MRRPRAPCSEIPPDVRPATHANAPVRTESGERRVDSSDADDAEVGVFLLDRDGSSSVPGRGWRGEVLFEGYWEASPEEMRAAFALERALDLEVHAIFVDTSERRWVVLRTSTRYSNP